MVSISDHCDDEDETTGSACEGVMHIRTAVVELVLIILAAVFFAACDRSPTSPIHESDTPASPAPSPAPSPVQVPAGTPRVEIVHDPDMWNVPAGQDHDGSYLLDWAGGWYCVWLSNIPHTTADDCRDDTFAFSWWPAGSVGSGSWSGATWSRGCQTYPNRTNPGACFLSPSQNSASELESITIVGRERTANGAESEVFRTDVRDQISGSL